MVFGKNKKALKIVEAEADEEVPEETEEEPEKPTPEKAKPKKELTVEEVLINHEQRIAQIEASLFRLRGI